LLRSGILNPESSIPSGTLWLLNTSWWIWVLIGLLLLSIEFVSTTMHISLFAVGAFVVAILVALGLDIPLWGLRIVD
jgi:membrane protein implicated in regulation of membrane protease activity